MGERHAGLTANVTASMDLGSADPSTTPRCEVNQSYFILVGRKKSSLDISSYMCSLSGRYICSFAWID
jgi:hypothetical protein